MIDDQTARNRLLVYSLARLSGLAIFFFGVAVIYTNVIRPGGWPQLGAVIAIAGVLDTLLLPRLLRRGWDRADRGTP